MNSLYKIIVNKNTTTILFMLVCLNAIIGNYLGAFLFLIAELICAVMGRNYDKSQENNDASEQ